MKTIILLSDTGSQKRDYDRFGIKILKKKFNILYLDCTKWLQPTFYKNKAENDISFKEKIIIKNFKQLKKILLDQDNKILCVIDHIGVSPKHSNIRNFIKKLKIKLIFMLNLEVKTKFNIYQKILFYLYKKNKFQALLRRFKKIPNAEYDHNYPDIFLLNGEYGKKLIKNNQDYISLCHFDYEIYLKEKKKIKNIIKKKNYALFLDQYLPLHSGQKYIGNISKNLPFLNYYENLENFFKKFEEKYKLEIVIAAHPRSDYKKNNLLSKKRKFFINKTPELVKNSKIVFTHTSQSLNFGVLFEKPIFFLTLSQYKHHDAFRPEFLSNYFKTFCFNIENKIKFPDKKKLFSFNKTIYQNYKKDYLVSDNFKGNSFWEEFSKQIK